MEDLTDYVKEDVAILLREHGYDEPCNMIYDHIDDEYINTSESLRYSNRKWQNSELTDKDDVLFPTLQEATRWIREKYNIYIDVFINQPIPLLKKLNLSWGYILTNFKDKETYDKCIRLEINGNSGFSSYEDALNDGIKRFFNNFKILTETDFKPKDGDFCYIEDEDAHWILKKKGDDEYDNYLAWNIDSGFYSDSIDFDDIKDEIITYRYATEEETSLLKRIIYAYKISKTNSGIYKINNK